LVGLFCWEDACKKTYCTISFRFKRMKKEQGLLIQKEKKIMDAAGIEPLTLPALPGIICVTQEDPIK
jgi:hypothetical protein